MGLDCSRPSRDYTELYLPAETFRVCNPTDNSCWCNRGHHRDSRYYYVERGGDGREKLHDPFDYMDRFMIGGGWPMPWKDVQHWTTRDYDRLGEIMAEYNNRLRGRQMDAWSAAPQWMNSMLPAMMMADELRSSRSPRRYRNRGSSRSDSFDFVRRIAKEYGDRIRDLEDVCYGTDAQLNEQQYKRKQSKLWEEFLQEKAMNGGMFGMNGISGMGMPAAMNPNMGMGMGMGGMMPQHFAAMGGGAPGMGAVPSMAAMGAMGMNGVMPGTRMPSMNGFGDDMLGGGLGGGLGRRGAFGRAGRRRGLPMADDFDDELGDLFGSRRRRRRGDRHFGDGFDDDLGGLDGSRSPRPTTGPRRGPKGPEDLLGGGGAGVTFDDEATRNIYPSRSMFPRSSETRFPSTGVEPAWSPMAEPSISSPPPGRPSRPPTAMAPSAGQMFTDMPPAGMTPGGLRDQMYGMDIGSTGFGQPDTLMSGGLRGSRPSRPSRGVSFHTGAGLSRPREDEENRGEPEAGGMADRRDAQP